MCIAAANHSVRMDGCISNRVKKKHAQASVFHEAVASKNLKVNPIRV
jgi:hypothetical protein